jgi:hypothetical protein
MRRGYAFLLSVSALGLLSPAAFGQYPYPYGPMPGQYAPMPAQYAPMPAQYAPMPAQYAPMPPQYMQPYGYPAPMPAYGPNPMMARPMYYQPAPMMAQPAPMWQPPQGKNTKVFVYGPLLDETVVAAPPNPVAPPNPIAAQPKQNPAATGVTQTQAATTSGGARNLPTYSKMDLMPEGCGPDCGGPACGPVCGPLGYEPPMRGRGHFISEVDAFFLVPTSLAKPAYVTTSNGVTTATDFGNQVDLGPRGSVGYMFHTGWGVRGAFEYLHGSSTLSVDNANPNTQITTPVSGAFQIISPSAALNGGIGTDRFTMTQRFDLDVVDIELLKQANFLDTTLLFGLGARYTRMTQSYTAARTNAGGTNGLVIVAQDQQDLNVSNRFEGWGPTSSFEVIQPLGCGFSLYGNVRGSFLWGSDRFGQNLRTQNRTVDAFGVATFNDVATGSDSFDSRFVAALETEAGLQVGHRFKHCYVFARGGAIFQRWWDVGNPTNTNGGVNFIGGTVRIGVTY